MSSALLMFSWTRPTSGANWRQAIFMFAVRSLGLASVDLRFWSGISETSFGYFEGFWENTCIFHLNQSRLIGQIVAIFPCRLEGTDWCYQARVLVYSCY